MPNVDPPAHLPAHVMPMASVFLQLGAVSWLVSYALFFRAGLRTRSYGIPTFALASNIALDAVSSFHAVDADERYGFATFVFIQLGVVYCLAKYGSEEWPHAPLVRRNLKSIFAVMLAFAFFLHGGLASWWIAHDIGGHRGKTFLGRANGADMMELAFWSALSCGTYMSVAGLAQLVVRGHSGGVDFPSWLTRALGNSFGVHGYHVYLWFYWPEMYEYAVHPVAILLMATAILSDSIYPFVLAHVRKTEVVLQDGRRISAHADDFPQEK